RPTDGGHGARRLEQERSGHEGPRLQPERDGQIRSAWLALLLFVFIYAAVKVVRAEEVLTQHVEAIIIQLNLFFRQVFPKKTPHQLASSPARLSVAVVERLWMR